MPFCIRDYEVVGENNEVIYSVKDNFQTINKIKLAEPLKTKELTLVVKKPSGNVLASIFQILVY